MIHKEHSLNWIVNHTAAFESDWMAVNRFLWMNAMTGATFWRATENRVFADPTNYVHTAEEFRAVIAKNPHASEFAAHVERRTLRSCFGDKNARELEQVGFIRFCLSCLQNCFHSPIFQLTSLKRCPFHDEPLRALCPHCAKPIGRPSTELQYFMHPLSCAACKRPFLLDQRGSGVFAGFEEGFHTFGRVEIWLAALRRVQFIGRRALKGFPIKSADYSTFCDSLTFLAAEKSRRLQVAVGSTRFSVINRYPLEGKPEAEWFALRRYSAPVLDDVEVAWPLAKSIGKYLSKCVRRICGHHNTTEIGWRRAERPFEVLQPILVVAPADCPACATLDRWRAYAGKLLALRNVCRSYRPEYLYDAMLYDGYRFNMSLQPQACVEALISSFTWFAVETRRAIQMRRGDTSEFPYRADDDLAREACRHPCIPMDLHRFHIIPHGFSFRTPKEYALVAYSLDYALFCLRRAVSERSPYGYWQTKELQGVSVPPAGKRDPWYLGMSEHLLRIKRANPLSKVAGRIPDHELQQELFPLDERQLQGRLWGLWMQHL